MKKRHILSYLILGLICLPCSCSSKKCEHQFAFDNYVAPTCELGGLTNGVHCSICGVKIIEQNALPPLGHSWDLCESKTPTEFEEGFEKYACSRCGETKEIVSPHLGHTHRYTKNDFLGATCNNDGHIEYYECDCGMTFVIADGSYVEIEKDETVIPKTGHHMLPMRENELPHFSYEQCTECGESFDYYLPSISLTCEVEPESDYSPCHVTTNNCLDEYRFDDVPAQIKVRGNWTSTLPKKPYRIKFEKKQSFFGLNDGLKAKSWVLLADYSDKSMIRNAAAFYVAKHLYSEKYYSSDCCFVEVYINGEYQGVYLLAEQQQIHEGRISVSENKKEGTNDTGYLIEYDQYYWMEDPSIVFELKYNDIPYFNEILSDESHFINKYVIKNDIRDDSQRDFIKDRIQSIWDVAYDSLYHDHDDLLSRPYKTIDQNGNCVDDPSILNPYDALSRIIDVESLLDTYLFNEIVQDMDIGYSSFYLSIDMSEHGNRLLTFHAPWDFDWCFGNSVNNIHQLYIGNYLSTEPNHEKSNPWLLLVSNSKWFWKLLQEKWRDEQIYNLKNDIIEMISFFTDNYSSYTEKEYCRWPEKAELVVWCSSENSMSARNQADDSANVVHYINRRFAWLNYYLEDLSRVKSAFSE